MADPQEGEIQGIVAHWQGLKQQAEGGELRMDTEIGEKLATHAEQLRKELQRMLNRAGELEHVSGFGSLDSAKALQGKFSQKAASSDDSAVKRLQQSIDVVSLMKDTYNIAIGKLNETDQSTAGQFNGLGNGE